jgi:hypothetical protein
MSKLVESYRRHVEAKTQDGPQVMSLRDEFPAIVEAMKGVTDATGAYVVWPCTVMLFLEGDTLKFCLNPKSGNRVAFGTVSDAGKGLHGVEQAIVDGNFEWKARGRRTSS